MYIKSYTVSVFHVHPQTRFISNNLVLSKINKASTYIVTCLLLYRLIFSLIPSCLRGLRSVTVGLRATGLADITSGVPLYTHDTNNSCKCNAASDVLSPSCETIVADTQGTSKRIIQYIRPVKCSFDYDLKQIQLPPQ